MNNDLDKILNDFATQLFAELQNTMPVDTGNMIRNSYVQFTPDEIKIIITAPTKSGFDYAYNVNENAQRGKKEKRNYHYVERCINNVALKIAQLYGGQVNGKI